MHPQERAVVLRALHYVFEQRLEELAGHDADRLMQAIDIWSEPEDAQSR